MKFPGMATTEADVEMDGGRWFRGCDEEAVEVERHEKEWRKRLRMVCEDGMWVVVFMTLVALGFTPVYIAAPSCVFDSKPVKDPEAGTRIMFGSAQVCKGCSRGLDDAGGIGPGGLPEWACMSWSSQGDSSFQYDTWDAVCASSEEQSVTSDGIQFNPCSLMKSMSSCGDTLTISYWLVVVALVLVFVSGVPFVMRTCCCSSESSSSPKTLSILTATCFGCYVTSVILLFSAHLSAGVGCVDFKKVPS